MTGYEIKLKLGQFKNI